MAKNIFSRFYALFSFPVSKVFPVYAYMFFFILF